MASPTTGKPNSDNNLREWTALVLCISGERRLGSAAPDLCTSAPGGSSVGRFAAISG